MQILRKPETIEMYEYTDFQLTGYQFHPAIKAPIAI